MYNTSRSPTHFHPSHSHSESFHFSFLVFSSGDTFPLYKALRDTLATADTSGDEVPNPNRIKFYPFISLLYLWSPSVVYIHFRAIFPASYEFPQRCAMCSDVHMFLTLCSLMYSTYIPGAVIVSQDLFPPLLVLSELKLEKSALVASPRLLSVYSLITDWPVSISFPF